MPTLTKIETSEWLPPVATVSLKADACDHEATSAKSETSMLPLALRDTEITEGDIDVLLRIARDKNAPAGRYKRIPKKVPTAEHE